MHRGGQNCLEAANIASGWTALYEVVNTASRTPALLQGDQHLTRKPALSEVANTASSLQERLGCGTACQLIYSRHFPLTQGACLQAGHIFRQKECPIPSLPISHEVRFV